MTWSGGIGKEKGGGSAETGNFSNPLSTEQEETQEEGNGE